MGKTRPEWPSRVPVTVRSEVIGYVTHEGDVYVADYQSEFVGNYRTFSGAEAAVLRRHLNRVAYDPRTAGEQR